MRHRKCPLGRTTPGRQTMADESESSSNIEKRSHRSLGRRGFLKTAGTIGAALATTPLDVVTQETALAKAPEAPGAATVGVTLRVNGERRQVNVDPRTTLLDCLRETLTLTGTKKGCDHGQCGACTVHVNGRRVLSCLNFAVMHDGHEITTVEGLGTPDALHPMQAAFYTHDAYQCGYCTSGQIMSAVALLREPCGPDDAAVKELMSGNICRCGAYANIVAAIQQVRGRA